jgi:hypothetical protein
VVRALATFGGDIVKDFDSAGEAVNRLLARMTDLIVELLAVKPLMSALAPAGGNGSSEASSAASSPTVARRAVARAMWSVSAALNCSCPNRPAC